MPTVAELLTPTFAAEPASLHSGASIGGAGQGVGGAGGGAAHSWVEPLDAASFSAFLPPPYRVLLLLALGILCFGSNLHGLHLLGLDPWPLLRPLPPLPAPSHSHLHTHTHARAPSTGTWSSARAHISSIYQVGALALSWALCGWASYRYYVDGPSQGDPAGRHAQTVQGIAVFGVLAAALWPGNLFHRPLRAAFGR